MKTLFLLPALIAVLNLFPAGQAATQTFTTLHSFTFDSDGDGPLAGLIISGNALYGTANYGGSGFYGTIFMINSDGSSFTNLHNFNFDYSDGINPSAGLILTNNILYGTAIGGGSSGNGTVFALHTDGSGFAVLHNLTGSDGAYPYAGLVLSGSTLYGTAAGGGSSGSGAVFALNTDGTGFTNLHSFTATYPNQTNSDGAYPYSGLILSGNTLYGTASEGGSSSYGTVFRVNTDGTGFTNLHNFTAGEPQAGLILSGNTLYGTAEVGGSSGNGTVFAINTDGTGFTNVHSFTAGGQNGDGYYTNSDGANPLAGLILSGNTLYGTTADGGSSGNGTVFAVNTDGTGFTNLHSFTAFSCIFLGGGCTNSDGANPSAGLLLSANTLYGTASAGGSSGAGTVFSISLPLPPPVAKCKQVTVSADANCSADASVDDGSFSPNAGDTIALVQSPVGPYPLGDTSVTLTVTDSHGASNSCAATVHVEGAAEQINDLIALVHSLGLQPGTANSLVAKLQAAASALHRGNLQAAFGNLGAFLNEANAQKGKKLTAPQGDLLNAEATRIRAVLGCR